MTTHASMQPWRQLGQFISTATDTLASLYRVIDGRDNFVAAFQRKEDAVLASAAPDLFHALEGMVLKHIADHGLQLINADHPLAQAQAAIAKARGTHMGFAV